MSDTYTLRVQLQEPDKSGRLLLETIIEEVIRWLLSHASRGPHTFSELADFPHYGEFPDGHGGSVLIDGDDGSDWAYWRLRWNQPDSASRIKWITDVRLATLGEDVEFDVLVRATIERASVSPVSPYAAPPRLVPLVIEKTPARVLGWPVDAQETWVTPANIDSVVFDSLRNPARSIPAVVITPDANGRYEADPRRLAERLAGLAIVYAVLDQATTYLLTDRIGGSVFSCFLGAVRIYWPGFDPTRDSPFRHKLWRKERLEASDLKLEQLLLNELLPAMERVLVGQPLMWDLATRERDGARRQEFDRMRGQVVTFNEALELLDYAETEIDGLTQTRASLQEQLDETQQRNRRLEEDLEAVTRSLWEMREENDSGSTKENETYGLQFKTVREAVDAACKLSGLRFLPDAFESADKSIYAQPLRVYKAFSELSELSKLRTSGLGTSIVDWLRYRDVQYASHISQTTATKNEEDYEFLDGNTKVLMQEHLVFGRSFNPKDCLRVHMKWSVEESAWVIGYVGKHLPNTKS